jgi:ribosomal protein S18 acetylase RimI-like enzyme
MSSTRIRRGGPDDAAALAAFAAATFAETFGADNQPHDLQAHLEAAYGVAQQGRELADPAVTTLLAHQGERLVAYAQVRRNEAPPACVDQPATIELQRFYVDRAVHGTGVATALMSAVQQVAGNAGARHIWLGVWERNARAIAFYTKVGFRDVGSTFFNVGTDRQTDRVLMAVVPTAPTR